MIFRLYPIVDIQFIEQNHISNEKLKNLLNFLDFFQLRIKNKQKNEILELINTFYELFKKKIILNDYWNFYNYADGIHLGIEDLKQIQEFDSQIKSLKKSNFQFAKNITEWLEDKNKFILGFSSHNLFQFNELYINYKNYLGYIAIGPISNTNTKNLDYPVLSKKELEEILNYIIDNKIENSIVFIGGMDNLKIKEIYNLLKQYEFFKNKTLYYASISNFLTNKIQYSFP